jgi:hypothetical protein
VLTPKQQRYLGAMGLLKNGETVPFTLENIERVPHDTGHYEFLHDKKLLYVGVAGSEGDVGDLHHRLLAYQEKDDFTKNGHHSKKPLRDYLKKHEGEIKFRIFKESITQARLNEHLLKKTALFNEDNEINEEKNHGVKVHHQVI